MSTFVRLMITGWGTTAAMIGVFALNESGKLLKIHKRIGEWLETLTPAANAHEEQRTALQRTPTS